mmetsp:Transcript_37064/g.106744  ORF Transcript_37064/g.106744 Transcript_37064/m.106744 type:complete len:298 (+) Transcript_37064:1220-2113(+)
MPTTRASPVEGHQAPWRTSSAPPALPSDAGRDSAPCDEVERLLLSRDVRATPADRRTDQPRTASRRGVGSLRDPHILARAACTTQHNPTPPGWSKPAPRAPPTPLPPQLQHLDGDRHPDPRAAPPAAHAAPAAPQAAAAGGGARSENKAGARTIAHSIPTDRDHCAGSAAGTGRNGAATDGTDETAARSAYHGAGRRATSRPRHPDADGMAEGRSGHKSVAGATRDETTLALATTRPNPPGGPTSDSLRTERCSAPPTPRACARSRIPPVAALVAATRCLFGDGLRQSARAPTPPAL